MAIQETAKQRLLAIRQQIDDLIKAIDSDGPQMPTEAAQKKASRFCLKCGKRIPKDNISRRGCHEACYKALMRRIERKETSEDKLIEQGLIAPAAKGGRPRNPDRAE